MDRIATVWIITALISLGGLLISCASNSGDAATPAPGVLSSDELRADVDVVVDALARVHPATVSGFTDEQERIIDLIYQDLSSHASLFSFWLSLNRLVVSMDDSHTSLSLNGVRNSGRGESFFLNTPVRWLEEGLYVTRDSFSLERGDRVVSVGRMRVEDALEMIGDRYVATETEAWLRHQAEAILFHTDFLRHNALLDETGALRITVERETSDGTKTVTVENPVSSIPQTDRRGGWPGTLSFFPTQDLAIMRFDTFRPGDEFEQHVTRFFDQVREREIGRVAIDLRFNTGGDSRAMNAFLRHLPASTVTVHPPTVRYSVEASDQRGYARTSGLDDQQAPVIHSTHDVVESVHHSIFTGEVFLLIGPRTYSSAGMMAAYFQDANLATLVGEPIGNSPPSYGDILHIKLPNSGFDMFVSHKRFFRSDRETGQIAAPDVLVKTTRSDIAEGSDAQVEYVKGMGQRTQ